jgi:hypothetical protein
MSHGQNLSSTSGELEFVAQYYFLKFQHPIKKKKENVLAVVKEKKYNHNKNTFLLR